MRRRSPFWLWTLPLVLLGGCLLPSFENVPPAADEGASGAGGGEPEPVAGATGAGGAGGEAPMGGGAPVGGGNVGGSAPEPVADTYVVQQGKVLKISAKSGVLANDEPSGLSVTAFSAEDKARPAAFDAELDIAAEGSVTFKPAPGFFGRYRAHYTVENAEELSATADVTFIVQPSEVELAAVEQGIGGVLLTGSATDAAGTALAPLGDVNADGFDDFAIGAPGASRGNGAVYVVFGRSDFSTLTLSTSPTSGEPFAVLAGSATAQVGSYVSTAGKFDADTLPDILIGSPQAASSAGALYVVFGSAELKQSINLAGLMPERGGLVLSGNSPGQGLGLQVAGGADFNGDEQADLLTGIYPDPTNEPTTGGVCMLLENPAKSQSLAATKYAAMKDSSLFKLPQSLAVLGDVNDDGNDDWLATSVRNVALVFGQADDSVPSVINQVQTSGLGILRTRDVATGTASVAAAADLDGDHHADFAYCDEFSAGVSCELFFGPIEASASLGKGDWRVNGFSAALGLPRVASAGDLNQDGFSDLLLADDEAAYVVFGRDAGFGAVDAASLGTDGFKLTRPQAAAPGATASVGDVNGDGYADFAVGEPTAAAGAGRVYVVLGGPYSADQR